MKLQCPATPTYLKVALTAEQRAYKTTCMWNVLSTSIYFNFQSIYEQYLNILVKEKDGIPLKAEMPRGG